MIVEGKGRVIINRLTTGEIAVMVDSSGRAVALLNDSQARDLIVALMDARRRRAG